MPLKAKVRPEPAPGSVSGNDESMVVHKSNQEGNDISSNSTREVQEHAKAKPSSSSDSLTTVIEMQHQKNGSSDKIAESISYLRWYYDICPIFCVVPYRPKPEADKKIVVVLQRVSKHSFLSFISHLAFEVLEQELSQ